MIRTELQPDFSGNLFGSRSWHQLEPELPILGVRILHTLRDTNSCFGLREIPFQMTTSLCEGDE